MSADAEPPVALSTELPPPPFAPWVGVACRPASAALEVRVDRLEEVHRSRQPWGVLPILLDPRLSVDRNEVYDRHEEWRERRASQRAFNGRPVAVPVAMSVRPVRSWAAES